MKTKEEVLQNCTVEGKIIRLPNTQLDRKLYQEVSKALELIGGKWKGGKVFGFVFTTDPTDLLEQIANGEKRNLKKEFQFFATPENLADELVYLADLKQTDTILEPSAGQGAIIKAINKVCDVVPDCFEFMDVNRLVLNKSGLRFNLIGNDFLKHSGKKYSKIIANPPFSKNQDIDHLKEMYACLSGGGRLVCITSESWVSGSQKKQVDFKRWLDEVNAKVIDVAKGSFKESGTAVGSKIVVINKSLSKEDDNNIIVTPILKLDADSIISYASDLLALLMAEHLAPNGKPSNLTPDQHRLVRTKAFTNWFGDWENDPQNASKVVDENGEPMVVYHGTPNSNFSIFRDSGYFTKHKEYADFYQNTFSSRLGGPQKKLSLPNTFAVFLKMLNPFDTRITKNRAIFQQEFYKKRGNGSPLASSGLPDWTDGLHLKEWIEETGQAFDGIIIDDGGTPEGGHRGLSLSPMKSSQIKLADGSNTTFDGNNPDIRFADGGEVYPLAEINLWYGDADYQRTGGVMVEMSPQQYLDLVRPLELDTVSLDNIEDLKEHILAGRKLDPLVIYQDGKEDGRHRAYACIGLGIKKVPVIRFDKFDRGGNISNRSDSNAYIYEKWESLVNMSGAEVRTFYDSEEGKAAGLTAKEASRQGIDSGRESARWIMKMKKTPASEWTPSMWRWAKKQISFISRMRGNRGELYDANGNKTRKHTSLLIWGHNPETRYDGGGNLILAPNGKESLTIDEVERRLGRKLNRWNDGLVYLSGMKYKKVYLRPEYKIEGLPDRESI